jgi:hypothetical protein
MPSRSSVRWVCQGWRGKDLCQLANEPTHVATKLIGAPEACKAQPSRDFPLASSNHFLSMERGPPAPTGGRSSERMGVSYECDYT